MHRIRLIDDEVILPVQPITVSSERLALVQHGCIDVLMNLGSGSKQLFSAMPSLKIGDFGRQKEMGLDEGR
jgi:hypothetical protein